MELSETQAKVLEILQEDPRISMRRLAHRVGVSTPTASATVKELEELGVISGYKTLLDAGKLGLHTFHLRIHGDLRSWEDLVESIVGINEVHTLRELDDGSLLAEVLVPSLDILDGIMRRLRVLVGVEKLEVSRVTGEFKNSGTVQTDAATGLSIDCFYCKKKIAGNPVKLELDHRKHYLCCRVCASEYEAKYSRLKDKAGSP